MIVLGIFGRKYAMNCVWVNYSVLAPALLRLFFIRSNVFGREKIDTKQTVVIVSNHCSQLDVVAGAAATPMPAKFLAKSELGRVPMFGYMCKMLAIMVDRKSKESREKSMRYMVEELKRGHCLYIYPEGTRNRSNEPLKEFKDGAFRAAVLAQVPLLVQTVVNTKRLNNPNYFHMIPGTVEVHWSTPIPTAGLTLEDVDVLKQMVREQMLAVLLRNK